MKKNMFLSGAVVVMTLALALASGVPAFADGGGPVDVQNGLQNELVSALATASGQTVGQINQDLESGRTLPQLAQQFAQQGTITQSTLAAAIQQGLAANEQQIAANVAQGLISGQMSISAGGSPPANGPVIRSNGGTIENVLIQALATAGGQTTDQIRQELEGGQTLSQVAQQLAQQGSITQSTLAAAIQQALAANDQQRAATMAQELISGQMPGPAGFATSTNGQTQDSAGGSLPAAKGIVLTIGSPEMSVNGTPEDIDPGYQTSPEIVNGSTFVPIRAIVEKLGGSVSWNAADQQVTITLNNTSIALNIDSKTATVNGATQTLADAPFISATGRTMLPLRFISESLGYTVNWDPTNRSITIQ